MRKILVLVILAALLTAAILPVSAEAEESAVYLITINYVIKNNGSYTALDSTARIYFFDNISEWSSQEVLAENITVDGVLVNPTITEEADNRWANVSLGDMSAGSSKTITVTQLLKVKTLEVSINPNSVGTNIPSNLLVYTQPVPGLYESDDNGILAMAQSLAENTSNLYYKAKQIFEYVVDNLSYSRQSQEHGALYAFTTKAGDCTEYSNLFVAMARAVGIPAKGISGNAYLNLYNIAGSGADINDIGHAWAIFYLPNVGWVPADGVWPLNIGTIGKVDYGHIVGASTGGDGVVKSQGIIWPGPGQVGTSWNYNIGEPADLTVTTTGSVAPEVLLDLTVSTSPQITADGKLTISLRVKNLGRGAATGLTASLNLDPALFEVENSTQQQSSLASGGTWDASFTVKLKDNAYGATHSITPTVTYASSYAGTSGNFTANTTSSVSVAAKPEQVPDFLLDPTFLLIVVAIIAAVGVVAAVVARR